MSKATNGIVLLAGLAMIVAAWMAYESPTPDIGDLPEANVEPVEAPERPERNPTPEPASSAGSAPAPEPEPEVIEHVIFEQMPETIRVPAIDVDHPLVAVGLNPDGSLQIPHDVHELGWYDVQGVLPGDEGTAVLAGHVDSRSQGPGAFYDLRDLEVGDSITMSGDEGDQQWVVTARRAYDKNLIPLEDIFIDEGEPRLVLVTCGGAFDRTRRSYTDNIVVYAELA